MGRACGTHGRREKRVQGFGGKARREKPLGRPRRRWEGGIKMDLRETSLGGGCGVDSPGSGYGLLAGCCECGDEPSGSRATDLVSYRISFMAVFTTLNFPVIHDGRLTST
jgi:hypothetical protein